VNSASNVNELGATAAGEIQFPLEASKSRGFTPALHEIGHWHCAAQPSTLLDAWNLAWPAPEQRARLVPEVFDDFIRFFEHIALRH
jgi:elongation factor P hydroxylase